MKNDWSDNNCRLVKHDCEQDIDSFRTRCASKHIYIAKTLKRFFCKTVAKKFSPLKGQQKAAAKNPFADEIRIDCANEDCWFYKL